MNASSELSYDEFERHDLDETHAFFSGQLPEDLAFSDEQFDQLWAMHPDEYHEILMHGQRVKTPRWQQAYGKDYHYTGNVNEALPVPELLQPLSDWCQETFDARLNGILLNWYDGSLNHYIGAHRDSTINMVEGAPIVTLSLGEQRIFRLRPWKGRGKRDFPAPHGKVFVMPWATNLAWTHEVPKAKRFQGRRISITLRAFV